MVQGNPRTSPISEFYSHGASDCRRERYLASLLGLLAFKESDRISIIHFFEVDILVKSSTDVSAIFDSIDRIRPTKYQLADTGNFSKISPARPAASKADILNSIFVGTSTLLYSDYMLLSLSWSGRTSKLSSKRVKKDYTSDRSEDVTPVFTQFLNSDPMKAGRKRSIPE